jgi:hypothetical protein
MWNPRSDLGFLTAFAQMWAVIFALRQPPAAPMSDGRRLAWRITAGATSGLTLAAGAFFAWITFQESDPWAQMVTAALTFGIFGMPTSFAALLVAALVAKVGGPTHSAAAVLLGIAFFVQWQFLAWSMLQRTRAPR